MYPPEPVAEPQGIKLGGVREVSLRWSCRDHGKSATRLAGKGIRAESVWEGREAVDAGLSKIHERGEGIRKATIADRGRIGAESRGVVQGVVAPGSR